MLVGRAVQEAAGGGVGGGGQAPAQVALSSVGSCIGVVVSSREQRNRGGGRGRGRGRGRDRGRISGMGQGQGQGQGWGSEDCWVVTVLVRKVVESPFVAALAGVLAHGRSHVAGGGAQLGRQTKLGIAVLGSVTTAARQWAALQLLPRVAFSGTLLDGARQMMRANGNWGFCPEAPAAHGKGTSAMIPSGLEGRDVLAATRLQAPHRKALESSLNSEQLLAVAAAIRPTESALDGARMNVCMGPPGTGKTATIVAMVGAFLAGAAGIVPGRALARRTSTKMIGAPAARY